MRRSLPCLLAACAAALATTARGQAPITFEPPAPTTDDVLIAVVHQQHSCRLWSQGVQVQNDSVVIHGSVPLAPPCTPELAASLETQRIVIGRLAARHYRVDATDWSDTPVILTADVTIASPPDTTDVHLDLDPWLPTSDDPIALRVRYGPATCLSDVVFSRIAGKAIELTGLVPNECPPAPLLDRTFALPPLPAGDYQVLVNADPIGGFHVSPPAQVLSLLDGRFGAALGWSMDASAALALAPAVQLTDQSGYFWFFSPGNVEVSVKILDGRALNGHFWVFASALTDRPFTLTVQDGGSGCLTLPNPWCPKRTYTSPAGQATNVLDFEAFPE